MEEETVPLAVERQEKRDALNVVPVEMREEEEGGDLLGTELADQALAERPQPAAAIEDDQRPVVQPDFQARRVSAVPRVTPLRSGSGTAHPPELESHEETF